MFSEPLIWPILTAQVFTIVIGVLAYLSSDGFPIPILMLATLLPWVSLPLPFRMRVTALNPISVKSRHFDAGTRTECTHAETCFKNLSRFSNAAMPAGRRIRRLSNFLYAPFLPRQIARLAAGGGVKIEYRYPIQLRRPRAVQGNMFGEYPIVDTLHATGRSPPISAGHAADEIHQVGETPCGALVVFAAGNDN